MKAIFLPLRERISSSERLKTSFPSTRMLPPRTTPGEGICRIKESPRVDFPEPDSPTTPSISPFFNEKDTLSTALTFPLLARYSTVNESTSNKGMGVPHCSSRGFSSSLNPSPISVKPSARRTIMMPGKVITHQAPMGRRALPSVRS